MSETKNQRPDFIAYTVRKAGKSNHWTRIGAAWKHKDGEGIGLKLEALPVSGEITLRSPKAEDSQDGGAQ